LNLRSIRAKLGLLRRSVRILTNRRRLGVHVWIPGNPYSDMLYRKFDGALAPQGMTYLEELDAFTRLPARGRVLWIHSEANYSWGRSGDELSRAHGNYLRSLDRWASKKGRVVWTVHDDGLHLNDPDPDRPRSIREKLRHLADCFHVHSEAARDVVANRFGVDRAKIVVIPHPSYAPLYARFRKKNASRTGLRRLLCFGHVKAYKNYGAVAEALEQLGPGSFSRLTIAGKVGGDVVLPEESYRRTVDLDLRVRFIADEEVAELFNDADFLLLPYSESLTSGAAALSMGFGVPVIAPDLGGMKEAVPRENWPLIYPADDPRGLARALELARDMSGAEYDKLAESCRLFGERIHPDRVSLNLLETLGERGIFER